MDFKTCFSIVYYRNFHETLLKWETNLYIDIQICVRNFTNCKRNLFQGHNENSFLSTKELVVCSSKSTKFLNNWFFI